MISAATKDFLTDISMIVGMTIGVLTVLDWLLSERQKALIRGYGERLWIWLDDQRYGRFTRVFSSRRSQVVLTVVMLLALLMLNVGITSMMPLDPEDNFRQVRPFVLFAQLYLLASTLFVARKLHPRIVDWVVRKGTVRGFFGRGLAVYVVSLLGCIAVALLVSLAAIGVKESDPSVWSLILSLGASLVALVAIGPLGAESFLLFLMLGFSLLWFLIVLVLLAVLRVVQFIVLRTVEYPKGPVLGLSGLLVGLAAIVKSFL